MDTYSNKVSGEVYDFHVSESVCTSSSERSYLWNVFILLYL